MYFYQLPEHAHYYNEVVGLLALEKDSSASQATVTVMFSKVDLMRLERVVGSGNAKKMIKKPSPTFIFSNA